MLFLKRFGSAFPKNCSIVANSNKMLMSSGLSSFKDLSKSLASEDDVQTFDQICSTKKRSKVVSTKKKFAVKKVKNSAASNLPVTKSSTTVKFSKFVRSVKFNLQKCGFKSVTSFMNVLNYFFHRFLQKFQLSVKSWREVQFSRP